MDFLLSIPNIVVAFAVGAIAGVIGGAVGRYLGKKFNIKSLGMIMTIVFAAFSYPVTHYINNDLKRKHAPDAVLQGLEDFRIFQVIFDQHPETKMEMKEKIQYVFDNYKSQQQISVMVQAASASIVQKYMDQYFVQAPDQIVYASVDYNYNRLVEFKNNPELCVSYFVGMPKLDAPEIDREFLEQESNSKADIIESAIKTPTPLMEKLSMDDIQVIIEQGYSNNGLDPQNFEKVFEVMDLPPKQGCALVTEFLDVMRQLGVEKSSRVFKSLMAQ